MRWSAGWANQLERWAGAGTYTPGCRADWDECIPARNALLDPGVAAARAATYESFGMAGAADIGDWYQLHNRYLRSHVYRRPRDLAGAYRAAGECGDTFDPVERVAEYDGVSGDLELVRVISISRLVDPPFVLEADVIDALGDEAALQAILDHAADRDDGRPVFASFRQDVRDLVPKAGEGDPPAGWANLLRDRLGLAHLSPGPTAPARVLVFCYPVRDAPGLIGAAPGASLAVPGVLDMDQFPAFCPAPSASRLGRLVSLASSVDPPAPEVLHLPMAMRATQFVRVGQIDVPAAPLPPARRLHLTWLRSEYDSAFASGTDADLLA